MNAADEPVARVMAALHAHLPLTLLVDLVLTEPDPVDPTTPATPTGPTGPGEPGGSTPPRRIRRARNRIRRSHTDRAPTPTHRRTYHRTVTAPDLRRELRARGYRLTPQRQLVLQAVGRLRHATPEVIAAEVQRTAPGVNITTVYRTLDLLEELGLVTHAHLDHGAPAYHVAENEHLHVVCRTCNSVFEAGVDLVADLVHRMATDHGFAVDVGHITLFGTCARCAGGDEPEPDRPPGNGRQD